MKKSIAAALLLVMVAWTEMAMAPMFLMHAGPMPPASEIADHMAGHHHQDHAMPPGHPCCPSLRKTESPRLEFAGSALPCQDEHRCCFRQGPQSVPALLSSGIRLSQEMAPAVVAGLSPPLAEPRMAPAAGFAASPPPILLGMVLRV